MTEPRDRPVTQGQLVTLVVPVSLDLSGQVQLDRQGLKEVRPDPQGRLDLKALPATLALQVDRAHKELVAPRGQLVTTVLLARQEIVATLVRLARKEQPELQAALARRELRGILDPPVLAVTPERLESLVRRARMVQQARRAFGDRRE